jgi:hypothetical protein
VGNKVLFSNMLAEYVTFRKHALKSLYQVLVGSSEANTNFAFLLFWFL